MKIRTYSELIQLPTFEERYQYLRLNGAVGKETFGFDRYIYESFLHSREWKEFRRYIIIRDNGCDLGIEDRQIQGLITIHHLNPITLEDVIERSEYLLNPEYAISTSDNTHKAIHYGDDKLLIIPPVERAVNDTCPWKN